MKRILWRWWESNPRPGKEALSFLHVYLFLVFGFNKGKQTAKIKPYILYTKKLLK